MRIGLLHVWNILHLRLSLSPCAMSTEKLRKFFSGRRDLIARIRKACGSSDGIIWFHAASFGEFEEARPVIEETRRRFPEGKILLTFFSPSGYEPLKDYPAVDWVFYLPLDFPWNAGRFLDAVRPAKAIFTLGEYWEFLLGELRRRRIPTYITSVRIRPDSPYLKWYGWRYRHIYRTTYSAVMTQNETAAQLVREMGAPVVHNVGDARFDRVLEIASSPWTDPVLERWTAGRKVFVAGSTVSGGDDMMVTSLANARPEGKYLIVPHDPDPEQIGSIKSSLTVPYCLYSESEGVDTKDVPVMIVDRVGFLAKLYRYGFAAYVGAGFTTDCPHSVIEPAAYGLPVAVGPRYYQNPHFVELMQQGAGFSFGTPEELIAWYDSLTPERLSLLGGMAKSLCESGSGATSRIMDIIFG